MAGHEGLNLTLTFGGRRYRLDPDKYLAAEESVPERPIPTDDEQMRELVRTLMGPARGDAEESDDG